MAPYNLAYIDNKKEKERVEIITNQSIKNLLGVFTANLSVIKPANGDYLTITDEDGGRVDITTEYFRFTDVSSYISCDDVTISAGDFVQITANYGDYGYISLSAVADINLNAKNINISGTLKKGSYTYSLPNKSGTIALTGDVKLYKFTVNLTVDDGFIVFELYSDSLLTYFTTGINTISSNIPIIFKALFKDNVKGEIYLASGGYGSGTNYNLPLYIEYSSNSSIKVYTLNVSNLTTSSLNLAALISPIKQMEVVVRSIY